MPIGFFVPKNVRIRQKTAKMMMIEAKIDATIETMVLLLLLVLTGNCLSCGPGTGIEVVGLLRTSADGAGVIPEAHLTVKTPEIATKGTASTAMSCRRRSRFRRFRSTRP